MLGLFGTLNLAARAMQAQMAGIETAGQNLANVNTTGYSRQRVQLTASPDITSVAGPEGTGVNAAAIQQVVSAVLNTQMQNQQSAGGYWNGQQAALQNAQNGLNEFLNGTSTTASTSTGSTASDSSTGLAAQLNGLFSAFQAVATSPTSTAARQALIGQAQTLAATFNNVSTQLGNLKTSLDSSLNDNVNSANQLLSSIADLNQKISSAEFNGGAANDLRDAREQDLENLSQFTTITTSTETNGTLDVSVGGQALVTGYNVADTLKTYVSGGGQTLVQTATGGVPLTLTGGLMQGTIDARDGTLATLQNHVNTLASALITQVNGVHNGGFSLTGSSGANFFDGADAATITVNAALAGNSNLIQTSGDVTATGDNSVALQLAQLGSATQAALGGQTFNDNYDAGVAALGSSLATANTQVNNQTMVAQMLTTQRGSVSGVSVDEEMTNLMSYQRAYEASAKLVTTMNTLMGDTLAMVV